MAGRVNSMETRFLNASTVIESLRDNGYTNTAYALAEIIDNSIQASATRVEIGFVEDKVGGTSPLCQPSCPVGNFAIS